MMNHIKDLKPLEKNPRKHNARNIGVIADGLNEVGAARSIVIDEHNVILAGNGTIEAAGQAGLSKLKIVEADGETIIAVRRKGLSDEQKKRLALIDNRASDLGDYDAGVLAEYEAENLRLSDLFSSDELQEIYEQRASELDKINAEGGAAFSPNLSPAANDGLVSEADFEKVKAKLREQIHREVEQRPLNCPHCGGQFYLNESDLK
jgi:ParB-like chromosome segregation protein Spo0J